MTAPFAEYELTWAGEGYAGSLAVGQRHVLDPRIVTWVARTKDATISVQSNDALLRSGWGGQKNHCVRFEEGEWWLHDAGSTYAVQLEGVDVQRARLHHGASRPVGCSPSPSSAATSSSPSRRSWLTNPTCSIAAARC